MCLLQQGFSVAAFETQLLFFTRCPVPKAAEYPHPEGRDVFFVSYSFKMPLASPASLYWCWPCLTSDIDTSQWEDIPDVYQPLPPQWVRESRSTSYSPVGCHSWTGEEKCVCFANCHPRLSVVVGGTEAVAPMGVLCHTVWYATSVALSGKATSRPAIAMGWEIWVFSWCMLRWQHAEGQQGAVSEFGWPVYLSVCGNNSVSSFLC